MNYYIDYRFYMAKMKAIYHTGSKFILIVVARAISNFSKNHTVKSNKNDVKSFHLDRETRIILNIWIKLSESNYLDQIIWIKLSGSNYLDQIIWINFLDQIIWINSSGSEYLDQIFWIKLSRSNYLD